MSRELKSGRIITGPEADEAFMSKEAAIALGKKVLGMATYADQMQVVVNRTGLSATRFALSRVTGGTDGSKTTIKVMAYKGFKGGTAITDRADEASLLAAVKQAEELAREFRSTPEGDQLYESLEPLPDGKLWYPSTVSAMTPDNRGEVIQKMLEAAGQQGDIVTAGFLAFRATARVIVNTSGLEQYDKMTDTDCTMTARTTDGTGSGWAGKSDRDWSKVDAPAIAAKAVAIAKQSQKPLLVEPGRYTVVLTPTAMGQFLQHFMYYALDAYMADHGMSVFSKKGGGNKWGLKVLDNRLSMVWDPEDPDGGYPFFDDYGLPVKKTQWIKDGILKQLSYYPTYARGMGHATVPNPHSIRMQGTENMAMEEMITKVRKGFLINRISSLSLINMRSLMMTGTTRDGLMCIENGKISKPAKNLRFTDSMMFFLNGLEHVGPAERISVGWSPEFESQGMGPIIAPSAMVRDFNFTATADAV